MADIPPQMMGATSPGASQDGSGLRMRSREMRPPADDEDELGYDDYEGPSVEQESIAPEERGPAKCVVIFSVFDLIASGIVICTSFAYAYSAAGVSLWCMGIQGVSHLLSSLMLMLRFMGERSFHRGTDEGMSSLLRKQRRSWLVREQIGAITMGIVMLLSSVALLFKAFRKIRFWAYWYKDHESLDSEAQVALEGLAWYGFSVYFIQAVFRWWAIRKLRRSILWHSFAASVVSMLFLLAMGVAASNQKEWSWKAEPICAIALSFVTLAEGIRIVIMHLDDMDTRLRHDPHA